MEPNTEAVTTMALPIIAHQVNIFRHLDSEEITNIMEHTTALMDETWGGLEPWNKPSDVFRALWSVWASDVPALVLMKAVDVFMDYRDIKANS